ncbi:hypothetical protein [Marilutibacter alkalisoli]|uniref:Uncharacterized protein n=1 Tax=Marilutibacter alkalisoli TaxID=2591633 RepID=A0A514BW88_9GAMM|nr:hypothetical protein [Lysobacter alkalisoli]QDH71575.1 hypothetical protein FKV23_16845 [Lysobacter alkalisoli]
MSIYKDLLFLHGYRSDLAVADDIEQTRTAPVAADGRANRSDHIRPRVESGAGRTAVPPMPAAGGCA